MGIPLRGGSTDHVGKLRRASAVAPQVEDEELPVAVLLHLGAERIDHPMHRRRFYDIRGLDGAPGPLKMRVGSSPPGKDKPTSIESV